MLPRPRRTDDVCSEATRPAEGAAAAAPDDARAAHPAVWATTSYFAEGVPYTVVTSLAPALFVELGTSLKAIGLAALFHLPWNLKFLWGPWVDRYETKRRWLVGTEVLLTAALVALALVAESANMLAAICALFVLLAFLSATQDIAIDGFYLQALDARGQARFVGPRTMAYRAAMLAIGGPGLVVIGRFGWRLGLLAVAAMMAALALVHARWLPQPQARERPLRELLFRFARGRVMLAAAAIAALVLAERELHLVSPLVSHVGAAAGSVWWIGAMPLEGWIGVAFTVALFVLLALRRPIGRKLLDLRSDHAVAYQTFLAQPKVGWMLAFVLTFRVGESLLTWTRQPFFLREMGMGLDEYGVASGTVGLAASIAATLAGGWLIARHGLRRWLWPFVAAQNALNLLYVVLALTGPSIGAVAIGAVITLERVGEGLGTAVFAVYLMRCCAVEHRAAHMAILTALMSVGFTVAGVWSGVIAAGLGYPLFYTLTFVVSLPAMLIMPFLPHLDREAAARPARG
jgi:PAT family beta-lactamase induction signal transducer AmpG